MFVPASANAHSVPEKFNSDARVFIYTRSDLGGRWPARLVAPAAEGSALTT
jgi:hypothetical protein